VHMSQSCQYRWQKKSPAAPRAAKRATVPLPRGSRPTAADARQHWATRRLVWHPCGANLCVNSQCPSAEGLGRGAVRPVRCRADPRRGRRVWGVGGPATRFDSASAASAEGEEPAPRRGRAVQLRACSVARCVPSGATRARTAARSASARAPSAPSPNSGALGSVCATETVAGSAQHPAAHFSRQSLAAGSGRPPPRRAWRSIASCV